LASTTQDEHGRAQEVWVVDEDEEVAIHSHAGKLAASDAVRGFSLG